MSAPGGSQRISSKTSFCVADATAVDLSLAGAPSSPRYATCEPLVQGMSVGWGDEYYYLLGGQSFDFSGNPSGAYDLVIEVDPRGRLVETDDGDNVSCVRVDVDVARRTVAILGACDGTLPDGGAGGGAGGSTEVVVSSIAPNTAYEDSVVGVTITGSGFVAGTTVTFENGTGPRPVASNVVVDDASTIRATVTVPAKRGKSRVRTWDVRVGSGVLVDGFTVVPR